jgi:hypothetical protein
LSEEAPNWAALKPRRACEHRERERADGEVRVTVLKPRIRSLWLKRLLGSWRPSPYRIHLDDVGTFVWLRCDGEHSLEEIGKQLSEAFGERVEPVEERLTRFVQQLRNADVIELGDAP